MLRLPNTGTYSLELATAQNGVDVVVCYSDATSSNYTGGIQNTAVTSATTTKICDTPAASTVRDIDYVNIKNTYAGSHTVTVQIDANGTNVPLVTATLAANESLNYTHGSGWQAKDANGNTKTTFTGNSDSITEGSTNLFFTAARVRAVVLTGLSTATNAVIAATDTILEAFGKLQAQITALGSSKANLSGGNTFSGDQSFQGSALVVSATGVLGYGAGSGGTATQGSSSGKVTTVTLNKPSGKITMNNASLGAGAVTGFVFNNSTLGANDIISVAPVGGISDGTAYIFWTRTISAGQGAIFVLNRSAGALSEAIELQFEVRKGATS